MATKIFGTAIPSAIFFTYVERSVLPTIIPAFFAPSSVLGGAITRAVGGAYFAARRAFSASPMFRTSR
jgi:hypothetical protein